MRVAVDAMGGDFAPREIVAGAVDAARRLPSLDKLILVGDRDAVGAELAKHGPTPGNIEICHASQVIGMEEKPADSVRRKKDSSISRAVDMVKHGQAEAMMSAGNTGAVVVAATFKLRKLEGVDRPAIAAILPTPHKPFVLIDAGANTECTPLNLAQFAAMGNVYAREILRRDRPVIGLMSIGTEETKGNEITRETFRVLSKSGLEFKGNIEGHDLFKGEIDVAVCDGFVGNVILKTSESVGHAVGAWIKAEFTAGPVRMLGALLLRGATRHMQEVMNPAVYGGAPLLGVNGVCIISHGSSNALAAYNAIRVAVESVDQKLTERLVAGVKTMNGVF